MLVLGIDTSTRVGGLGLYDSVQGLIGEENLALDQTHSERMLPMLEHLLQAAGVTLEQIDGFAVTVGPGSFTGLRIGVTTAKTLAQVIGVPLIGISTLEVTAYNLLLSDGIICPIFDARNRRVYTAQFIYPAYAGQMTFGAGLTEGIDPCTAKPIEKADLYGAQGLQAANEGNQFGSSLFSGLIRLAPDDACTIDELVAYFTQRCERVYFAGDALPLYRATLGAALGERAYFPPASLALPRGGSVAELGARGLERGERADAFLLTPNYLKPAEAEVTWQKKHGSR